MILRWLIASIHLLGLVVAVVAVFTRARALGRVRDAATARPALTADNYAASGCRPLRHQRRGPPDPHRAVAATQRRRGRHSATSSRPGCEVTCRVSEPSGRISQISVCPSWVAV